MRLLVLSIWLLLAGCAHGETSYIVFGDSLSSPSYSWANQLNRYELGYFQVHAQAGRRMVDLDIPRDLVSRDQRAIVYLGTNDAGSEVPIELFIRYARSNLLFLRERGFNPIVILPPEYPFVSDVGAYRSALQGVAGDMGLRVLDPEFPFPNGPDLVHPTPGGHFWLAAAIAAELGLQ